MRPWSLACYGLPWLHRTTTRTCGEYAHVENMLAARGQECATVLQFCCVSNPREFRLYACTWIHPPLLHFSGRDPSASLMSRFPCSECNHSRHLCDVCHSSWGPSTCLRSTTQADPIARLLLLLLACLQALTPLTIGRKRIDATALGALWGFGHSTGQLILGLVFVLLQVRLACT